MAPPNYADGIGEMVDGPSPRYVSNRIFNDRGQNVFSENGVTQWAFTWGQFLDHTIGLRQSGGEIVPIPFDSSDPLEDFTNDLGGIDFDRSPAAPGTGITSPREQINTVSSYLDGWAIYGGTAGRLDWLREGPLDGDPTNNDAHLLTSSAGYLPRASARGDPDDAPEMQTMGSLVGSPQRAVIAGDVRANENIALTRCTRCSSASTTASSTRSPTTCPSRRSSRSRGASSSPRSSASRTRSSCPRSASGSIPTRATGPTSTPRCRTSSPWSATEPTA